MSRAKYLLATAALIACGLNLGLALARHSAEAAAGWTAWTIVVVLLNLPRRAP